MKCYIFLSVLGVVFYSPMNFGMDTSNVGMTVAKLSYNNVYRMWVGQQLLQRYDDTGIFRKRLCIEQREQNKREICKFLPRFKPGKSLRPLIK